MTAQELELYLGLANVALKLGLTTGVQIKQLFASKGVSDAELNARIRATMADAEARRLISALESGVDSSAPDGTGTP